MKTRWTFDPVKDAKVIEGMACAAIMQDGTPRVLIMLGDEDTLAEGVKAQVPLGRAICSFLNMVDQELEKAKNP